MKSISEYTFGDITEEGLIAWNIYYPEKIAGFSFSPRCLIFNYDINCKRIFYRYDIKRYNRKTEISLNLKYCKLRGVGLEQNAIVPYPKIIDYRATKRKVKLFDEYRMFLIPKFKLINVAASELKQIDLESFNQMKDLIDKYICLSKRNPKLLYQKYILDHEKKRNPLDFDAIYDIKTKYNKACAWCGRKEYEEIDKLEIDHILPFHLGGIDSGEKQPLCRDCHWLKGVLEKMIGPERVREMNGIRLKNGKFYELLMAIEKIFEIEFMDRWK